MESHNSRRAFLQTGIGSLAAFAAGKAILAAETAQPDKQILGEAGTTTPSVPKAPGNQSATARFASES